MALRELRLYRDEILTTPCRTVTDVNDHVRLLLDDMVDTLLATPNSTVLAANQLGNRRRLIVVQTDSGITKLVNPVIIEESGEQDCIETCVSIKDIQGLTVRPQKVVVEALDENGEKITLTGEDDVAQRLCHGIDYLDGVLFITKVLRFIDKDEDSDQ